MTSFGPTRNGALGYDGEIYTLYVDPSFYGRGSGRALMQGAFAALRRKGHSSCIIWAHAKNPVRFFYEAIGGRLVAEIAAKFSPAGLPFMLDIGGGKAQFTLDAKGRGCSWGRGGRRS